MKKLKPCPLCGGKPSDKGYGIMCEGCGLWLGDGTQIKGNYVDHWNQWASARLSAQKKKPTCRWKQDYDGVWDTACGEKWQFLDGGPVENGMKYCHHCGRIIRVAQR